MRLLIGILLLSVFLTLSGCSSQIEYHSNPKYKIFIPSAAGTTPTAVFNLNTSLPDLPEKIQLYRVVKPEVTTSYVAEIGIKLGISGEVSFGSDNIFHMRDQDAYLEVYPASGAIIYGKDNKLYSKSLYDVNKSPNLPTSEEAITIGTNFLKKRGWFPSEVKVDEVIIGGWVGNTPDHLGVIFSFSINNYRLTGPAFNYNLRLADKGEVVQMMIYPVSYKPHEEVEIKSVEQAYNELIKGKQYVISPDSTRININNISIGYWMDSMSQGQEYIIPVFIFRGECLNSNDKIVDNRFTAWIEAVK